MDTGFAPIADRHARILILGSMPGQASLAVRHYYAYRQNAFWPIMQALLGIYPQADFKHRYAALRQHNIALWDVMYQCIRPGSLDSKIQEDSIVVNDFAELFSQCPRITHIFFNGAKSGQSFNRYVKPTLDFVDQLTLKRLPSTSPAHASLRFDQKLAAWRMIKTALN